MNPRALSGEGGVNSGKDASEVKPLIMITNWSWLLERQAAAVGRPPLKCPCLLQGPRTEHEETLKLCAACGKECPATPG